jgi:dTDP-4-dehydrorhamnose 3,5-epimerase
VKRIETPLKGAYLIEPTRLEDERGFFARTYCRKQFDEWGLNPDISQCSVAFNKARGTLRGMHYQASPYWECKLVRCTMGSGFDVIIDLRRDSPTFKKWYGIEISATNRRMVYVPRGFAHGLQTLEDNTEIFYQITPSYEKVAQRGIRWNDPAFGIKWPHCPQRIVLERDANYPDFVDSDLK